MIMLIVLWDLLVHLLFFSGEKPVLFNPKATWEFRNEVGLLIPAKQNVLKMDEFYVLVKKRSSG